MSLLAKIVRAYLVGRSGYAAAIPGGISPEVVAIGNPMPYVYYSGVSKSRTTTCGNVLVHQLRIEEEGDQAEFTGDGSDEPIRTTSLDVVGVYEPV